MLVRGARLGPYQLVEEIGVGGMGHVYRAVDTRLDRDVALKVLPPSRWSDSEFRQRFQREALAVASLNDSNICALYDVGEVSLGPEEGAEATVPYLVMELLEGQTLRDLLDEGRLPIRKALAYGLEIANGLAAAHEKWVVHRDLKPENVFITRGERVKLLDFGLAKAMPSSGRTAAGLAVTEPGMLMGTTHYMSPEQVTGKSLDPRSDIFSLGVVLYEMLTGREPFRGGSTVETMNAILREQPASMMAIAPDIPEAVESLVWRCLEKDPAHRFSSARDVAFAIETAIRLLASGSEPAKPRPQQRTTRPPAPALSRNTRLAIVAVILAFLAAAIALSRRHHEPPSDPPRMRLLTYSGHDSAAAASADGRLIAFVSTRDGKARVWLKQLADGTEVAVTSGPADSAPRFSPDSSLLLFTRAEGEGSAVYRVAVVGGEPRKLVDNAFDGDWSADGKRIAFIRNRVDGGRFSILCVAPVDGGSVRELASSPDEDLAFPRWSPDGRWIAVSRHPHGTTEGSVLLVATETDERRVLSRREHHGLLSAPAWVSGGDAVVYVELDAVSGRSLRRTAGSAAVVLHPIDGGAPRVLVRNAHGAADTIDVAGDGRLIFSEDMSRQNLQEVALSGSGERARWLSRGLSVDRQPVYTRDGKGVVFATDRGGNVDLWEASLANGTLRRLTDHDAVDWDPFVAADGTLFWSSNRTGHFEIWRAAGDGAGAQEVSQDGSDAENPSVPSDVSALFYDGTSPDADGLFRQPLHGGDPQRIVGGETIHPVVSADGAYVVYQVPEPAGPSSINVVRLADGKVFTLASGINGVLALRAHWIGATRTIAFRALDSRGRVALFSQEFDPARDTTATRRPLLPPDLDIVPETYAISPDGTRAVVSVVEETSGIMIAEELTGVSRTRPAE